MSAPYEKAITGITGLFSELVDDDDLRAKLEFETDKLRFELDKVLLSTKTNPYVDGFVKVLIAFRDIIIPMLRPLGAAYITYMGIDMGMEELAFDGEVSAFTVGLSAAFPSWGVSRHVNKQNEQKTERAIKRGAVVTEEDFE